jgi:hypothetical protein
MARRLPSVLARPPLDAALVRFVEALADAAAERDHRAALAGDDGSAKAKRRQA